MKTATARRGLTLVELLIVIAVLAVVAGLVLPAVARARRHGHIATDISNLRQMGLAAGLYMEANNDRYPLSAAELVNAGFAPKSIAASPGDQTPKGLANHLVEEITGGIGPYRAKVQPFRHSYVGVLEYTYGEETFRKRILQGRNPGWLVSIARMQSPAGTVDGSTGVYQRLLVDGSVQTRTHQREWVQQDGSWGFWRSPLLLFVDEDRAWVENQDWIEKSGSGQ